VRAAAKPSPDRSLLWYLRTQLALKPRTLELNEFILRKADGFRSKYRRDVDECDWHFELAAAVKALSCGPVDLAYEMFMRSEGPLGIRRMNLVFQGYVAPGANWYERLIRRLPFDSWFGWSGRAEAARLSRAVQVVPKSI